MEPWPEQGQPVLSTIPMGHSGKERNGPPPHRSERSVGHQKKIVLGTTVTDRGDTEKFWNHGKFEIFRDTGKCVSLLHYTMLNFPVTGQQSSLYSGTSFPECIIEMICDPRKKYFSVKGNNFSCNPERFTWTQTILHHDMLFLKRPGLTLTLWGVNKRTYILFFLLYH